jgi:O-antigen/teichoic acid export membrane protein
MLKEQEPVPATRESVFRRAQASLKWSIFTELVSRTAQPIVFVILAKLLTPEDYGVVGTAMIAIAFCQMFWEAGLGKALIQIKESPLEAAQVVFWTNLALGGVIYVLLFVSAPAIAQFFHSPKSAPVLRVLGLQVILASLTSVQQALLVRELDFRRLFWIKLFTAFVPGFFSIPLAFYGQGVWALVAGTLAGQAFNLLLLWTQSTWRPRWHYDAVLARRLFGFGLWIVLESLGAWLIVWGDSMIVGRYLGVHDLGVYRTGLMMVTLVFGLLLNPIVPIMYPTFSRLQDDLPALSRVFHEVNRVVIAFALPIGTGLFLVGPEMATSLFGNKWHGLGLVIGVLGLMHGTAWLVGLNAELYRAMGRPDINTKLMFGQLVFYLPAFYLAAQEGLSTFVFTRLGVAMLATPIHIWLCVKVLRASPFYLWHEGKAMFLGSAAMAVVVLTAKAIFFEHSTTGHGWLVLAALVALGIATYAAFVWCLDPKFVAGLRGRLGRAASQ